MDPKSAPPPPSTRAKAVGFGAAGGLVIGLVLGLAFGNIALGLCFGLIFGGGAGAACSKKDKD